MTLDEFWNGNPLLFYLARDLYIEQEKEKRYREDEIAWLQGAYFVKALRQTFKDSGFIKGGGEATQYPDTPLSEKQRQEEKAVKGKTAAEIIKEKVLLRAETINARLKNDRH